MDKMCAIWLWNDLAFHRFGIAGNEQQSEEVSQYTALGGISLDRLGSPCLSSNKDKCEKAAQFLEDWAQALREEVKNG